MKKLALTSLVFTSVIVFTIGYVLESFAQEPPPRDECRCIQLHAQPNNKGVIFVDAKDLGTEIQITIGLPWKSAITCGGEKEGECQGKFDLSASSGSWMTNVPAVGNGLNAQVIGGSESLKTTTGDTTITCKGKCKGNNTKETPLTGATFEAPPPTIKKFATVYQVKVKPTDPNASAALGVTGSVTMEIKPSGDTACDNKTGWKMVLVVDSNKKEKFDPEASDYDGDGATNKEEKNAKTDPWDPTDKPTP